MFRLERSVGIAFVYEFLILHIPLGSTIDKHNKRHAKFLML